MKMLIQVNQFWIECLSSRYKRKTFTEREDNDIKQQYMFMCQAVNKWQKKKLLYGTIIGNDILLLFQSLLHS